MRKQLVGAVFAGLAAMLAAPVPALAQSQAFTSTTVNLYAGPAGDYPVVAQVPGGVSLAVMGCVAGYSWCDVSLPGLRGWVYGGYLSYPYQGARVPLMNYGATIGLPILTFSLGAYWGSYYRDRPWYGNQSRWNRHPGPRPGPPPAVRPPSHGARPPGGNHGNHGNRPGAGNGNQHRPPGNNGARPPGQGGARPPGQGGARPPGNSGARPPGQGGRPGGGGGGGGGGGNRPPGGGGGGGRPGN
ncbi:SH3 domain-containing protein [Paraburkholderia bannensis]|uniref:SH3 domain-containing protein n=1 Tax=Paraburkholderia bannensis TaxID=765414 RepID=UPI002AB66839|nr:SH3 domain-containing protein [Paraburkholderia bannensis]